jgi:hypothetical protein
VKKLSRPEQVEARANQPRQPGLGEAYRGQKARASSSDRCAVRLRRAASTRHPALPLRERPERRGRRAAIRQSGLVDVYHIQHRLCRQQT